MWLRTCGIFGSVLLLVLLPIWRSHAAGRASTHGNIPHHPLLHPLTAREAQLAAEGCDGPVIFYTSFDAPGAILPPVVVQRAPARCVLAFIGERVEPPVTLHKTFMIIVNRRTEGSAQFSHRKMSRIPKLLPHLLFPGRLTAYFDVKLQLQLKPRQVAALLAHSTATTESASGPRFLAFRHPCIGQSGFAPVFCKCVGPAGCSPWTWLLREADDVRARNGTSDPLVLVGQVAAYTADRRTPPEAYREYIDGALLIQQDAAGIFDPWQAEYFRHDRSDRDQLAFAHATAHAQAGLASVRGCAEVPMENGHTTSLCHWYRDRSLAKLVRLKSLPALSTPDHVTAHHSSTLQALPQLLPGPQCVRRWRDTDIVAFLRDHPQRAYFAPLMRLAGFSVGVEVGVAHGRYSELFLQQAFAPDKWFMVEPFPHEDLVSRLDGLDPGPRPAPGVRREQSWARRGIGTQTKIVYLNGLSSDNHVLRRLRREAIDFVYLDGAHDYKTVKQELRRYWPRVREGGILAGHDYCNHGEPSLECLGCEKIPPCRPYTKYGVAHGKPSRGRSANQAGVVRAVQEWLRDKLPTLRLHHTAEDFTRTSLADDGLNYSLVITNTFNPSWYVIKPHTPSRSAPIPPTRSASIACEPPVCGLGRIVESPAQPRLAINLECAAARSFVPPTMPIGRVDTTPASGTGGAPITLALIYYAAPSLLLAHLQTLKAYPNAVRSRIHVLIVDDGSPQGLAASTYMPAVLRDAFAGFLSLTIVRIEQDLPWNIGGARNLAFHLAPTPRVMLLDMDTPAPQAVMAAALALPARDDERGVSLVHRFNRVRPDGTHNISPAAVLTDAASYWAIGGCDEDFVGNYGHTHVHFWHRARTLPPHTIAIQTHHELLLQELPHVSNPCDAFSRAGVAAPSLRERCMASATVHAGALAAAPSAASKDPTVNALLFRWKVRTGRWSTNYLRFTWAVVLSSSTDRASAVIV